MSRTLEKRKAALNGFDVLIELLIKLDAITDDTVDDAYSNIYKYIKKKIDKNGFNKAPVDQLVESTHLKRV